MKWLKSLQTPINKGFNGIFANVSSCIIMVALYLPAKIFKIFNFTMGKPLTNKKYLLYLIMKKNFQGGDVKNCTIIPKELFWIQ